MGWTTFSKIWNRSETEKADGRLGLNPNVLAVTCHASARARMICAYFSCSRIVLVQRKKGKVKKDFQRAWIHRCRECIIWNWTLLKTSPLLLTHAVQFFIFLWTCFCCRSWREMFLELGLFLNTWPGPSQRMLGLIEIQRERNKICVWDFLGFSEGLDKRWIEQKKKEKLATLRT